MNAIASLLSRSPSGFGDDIGKTNLSLIRRVCRADGRLLQRSKFITDQGQDLQRIEQKQTPHRPYEGEIWSAFSARPSSNGKFLDITSFVVFTVDLSKVQCRRSNDREQCVEADRDAREVAAKEARCTRFKWLLQFLVGH